MHLFAFSSSCVKYFSDPIGGGEMFSSLWQSCRIVAGRGDILRDSGALLCGPQRLKGKLGL
jgi:hypothetical protein